MIVFNGYLDLEWHTGTGLSELPVSWFKPCIASVELSTLSLKAVHRRLYTAALLIGKCQKGPAESGDVIT